MPSIYTDHTLRDDDDLETRQRKVYLAVTSAGESLYCLGADLGEILKRLNAYEGVIGDLRAEVRAIRSDMNRDVSFSLWEAMEAANFHAVANRDSQYDLEV